MWKPEAPWLNPKSLFILLATGMAFWLLDNALDDFFVFRRSPLTFWFFEASPHEIFRRLTTFGTILLFGALIFRYAFFLNPKGGQEELLRESEERFRTLVQTAGSVILLLSPDGLILEFNQEAERISGTQRHEALGKNAINFLIPEKFQAQAQEKLQRALAGESLREYELPVRLRDGSEQLFRWNIHRVSTGGRQPVAVVAIGTDLTGRNQDEMALRKLQEQLHSLTAQMLTAEENERRRISLELHDELGQSLSYLKFQIGILSKQVARGEDSAQIQCGLLRDYVGDLMEKVRRISQDLNPKILDELGISSAIRYLVEEFSEHYQPKHLIVEIDEIDDLFPQYLENQIFRIVQESLTNIFKYADASRISVTVRKTGEHVTVSIDDNGRGFDVQSVLESIPKGIGLVSLRERVRSFGGDLDIWSQKDVGTRIICNIPIELTRSTHEALSSATG